MSTVGCVRSTWPPCRSHHPCGAVDVHPHVLVVGDARLAAVDAHPHTDTDFVQAILRLDRGRDGVRRSLEDDEERVAAGVEHDAIVSGDCGAHHAVVLGKETGVVVAELVQQSRGALDVGEEEGDCSGREVEHADRMRVGPPDC